MKIFIWFLCILANAIITTVIKESGVILGAIPSVLLFGGTMWLARTLCKKWDEHKQTNTSEQNAPTQASQPANSETNDQIQFCRKCGEKLIDNSRFCRKCGTEIVEG